MMRDFTKEKQRLGKTLRRQGIDEEVVEALIEVDRHLFMPGRYWDYAYQNRPQSIGHGQTISQPYTVAYMVQLLQLEEGNKVLEGGAGSGYNAAVMTNLIGEEGKIYSLEVVQALVKQAKENLERTGYADQVEVIHADAYNGYEEGAPYDRVIVTAASRNIPEALVKQLKIDGIMVIPVNTGFGETMKKVVKRAEDDVKITNHGKFRFVPMVSGKRKT